MLIVSPFPKYFPIFSLEKLIFPALTAFNVFSSPLFFYLSHLFISYDDDYDDLGRLIFVALCSSRFLLVMKMMIIKNMSDLVFFRIPNSTILIVFGRWLFPFHHSPIPP